MSIYRKGNRETQFFYLFDNPKRSSIENDLKEERKPVHSLPSPTNTP